MAQVKLKTNSKDDNYGTILIEEDGNNKYNMGFFKRLRYRLTYKKIKDDKEVTLPFLSLFRFADGKDIIALIIGVISAILQGFGMTYIYILLSAIFVAILNKSEQQTNNDGQTSTDQPHSWEHLQVFLYVGIASFILGYLKAVCFTWSAERQIGRIRLLIYKSILQRSISFYDTHQSAEVTSMLSGHVDKIGDGIGMKLALSIMTMSHLVSSIIVAIFNAWELSLVILCLTPPLFFIGPMTGKRMSTFTRSELDAYSKGDAIAQEVFTSIRTVFAHNAQDNEIKRYAEKLSAPSEFALKKARIGGLQVGLNNMLTYLIYAVSVTFAGVLINTGRVTIAQFLTAFLTAGRSSFYALMISPQFHVINEAKGAAQRLWQFIDETVDRPDDQGNTIVSLSKGISFENVSFSYPSRPNQTVLNRINFRLNPGETVAVVGSSGSGKSTCAQLLLRFYEVEQGSIRVNDGPPINQIDLDYYRQQIATVDQQPVLFTTTIRDNIQFGNMSATFADIENAARQANVHDFILGLPKQYDTVVDHRGTQLSGGEKQRICLARALVRQSPILLLDEVTSALDNESETIIRHALEKACRESNRTTLMITHRLSTIRNADRIILIRDGIVIEQGTHQQLMSIENGIYATMIMKQEKDLEKEQTDGDETEQRHESATSSASKSSHLKGKESSKSELIRTESELDGKPMSTFRSVWELSRSAWPWLLFGCLSSIIVSFRTVAWTFLLAKATMGLAESSDTMRLNSLLIVSFALLILGIGVCFSAWLSYYFFGRASAQLTQQLRLRTFKALIRQEIGWFDRKENNPGRLTKLLESDAAKIQSAIGTVLVTITEMISALLSGIIFSGIVLGYKITIVYIILIIILTTLCWLYTLLSKCTTKKQRGVLENLNMIAIESVQNIRTVFELNVQKTFIERFSKLADKSVNIPLKYMHLIGLFCGIEMSRMFFLVPTVLALAVHLESQGSLTTERLILVVSFGSFVNQTYTMMYAALPKLGSSLAAAQSFTLLFQRKVPIDIEYTEKYPSQHQIDEIKFSHVKFSYPTRPELNILNDLKFSLKSGQSIAFVGSTGCGKSTTLSLIERFYDVTDGQVQVNFNDIREINLKHHRSCIGYVGQEPVLFNMSIRDNIIYGNEDTLFTIDDIIQAAKKANIHDFIETLPQGYDTSIGQFGSKISGGQRQRIALARAFVRKPQLLLLDEPTSALDVESERLFQESLQNHAGDNVTSITVAHRLSTIRHVDIIYVLKRGRIVESGKHDDLINRPNGVYAQLYYQSINPTNA